MQGCCFRVLKEVHPDVGISKQGMQVMQTFAVDMFDRIMVEASRLCRISNKATLSSREIQTAGGPMPCTCLIHAFGNASKHASYPSHTCLIHTHAIRAAAVVPQKHLCPCISSGKRPDGGLADVIWNGPTCLAFGLAGCKRLYCRRCQAFAGQGSLHHLPCEIRTLTAGAQSSQFCTHSTQNNLCCSAVRLLMPGELSKHAVTEGTKAVTKATQ